VLVHRWLSIALLAWVAIVSVTGAWLVFHNVFEDWLNPGRYDAVDGDVGPQAAVDAAVAAAGEDAEMTFLTLPNNGARRVSGLRGVPIAGAPAPAQGEEAHHEHFTYFVDPGTGRITDRADESAGISWWLYRGHMYLWQDWGPFGAFDPESGWCTADADGVEPGGVTGAVCDVLPDGMDMVGRLGVLFIVVLLTGVYLWYWPGVRRWATAFVIKRGRAAFTFNLSLHKVIGFVLWGPLLVVAFTGVAFAFPNLNSRFENATPARRDFFLWTQEDDAVSEASPGRERLDLDEALAAIEERFPDRTVRSLMTPWDHETARLFGVGEPRLRPLGPARRAPGTRTSPSTSSPARSCTTAPRRRATRSISSGTTGPSHCTRATSGELRRASYGRGSRSARSRWAPPGS